MRKTKEDAELTKQNLLEAAFQLFLENGYDRTSLNVGWPRLREGRLIGILKTNTKFLRIR